MEPASRPKLTMNYLSSLNVRSSRIASIAVVVAALVPFAAANSLSSVPMVTPKVVFRSLNLGPTDPNKVVHIGLSLAPADPEGLQAFADSVSDPDSPNYLHFITPQEVGQRFGVSQSVIDAQVAYLASNGFKIKLVAKNRMAILATGTVAQAEKAFSTKINKFQTLKTDEPGNANYISFQTPPKMPAELAKYVIDVDGLQTFTRPKPRTTLTPSMTQTLYNILPFYSAGAKGEGRTVGISNFDGYLVSNVPVFYSSFNLPVPAGGAGSNVSIVSIDGGSGSGPAFGEGDLDIQMGLSCSPLANLIIYDGGSGLLSCLVKEANDDAADIISESYGWALDNSTADACHNQHVSMTAQGITYTLATGDNGTQIEPYAYPNYDPEVFEVGGTIATTNAAGVRQSEIGWDGSGAGWCTETNSWNSLPSWQVGDGVPTTINKRLFPDVSLHAASSTGAYNFVYAGSVTSGDGTSFSSPVFASNLAVVEQQLIIEGKLPTLPNGKRRLGRINDLVYKQNGRPDVWTDMLVGDAGQLPNGEEAVAGPNWDFVTGFGVPDFTAFEEALTFIPPSRVAPTLSTIFQKQGSGTTGGYLQLPTVDQQYFGVSSKMQAGIGQVAAAHIAFKLSGNTDLLSFMKFTINAKAMATTSGYAYLYNYSTKTYDLVKSFSLFAAGKSTTFTVQNPENYFNKQKKVQLVIRAVRPTRLGSTAYTLNLDQTVIDETF